MDPASVPTQTPRTRHIKTTLQAGGAALLVIVGFFGFLVAQNIIKIQRGEFDISKYQARDQLTTVAAAEATQIRQVARTEVETADDPTIGSSEAAVTIVQFADFQCPYCAQSVATIKTLLATFGNDIRIIHRDFPVETLHPDAFGAAVAGECARQQGKFWQFHDLVYLNQEVVSDTALASYAGQAGLNMQAFTACTQNAATSDEVAEDYQAGLKLGVRGTPTWFVNGYRVEGAIPADIFSQLVRKLIERQS